MVAIDDIVDATMLYWALSSKVPARLTEHGFDTYALLWKVAVWDMLCCFKGEFSALAWNGQPWPAGHPRNAKSDRTSTGQ